ncbi:hypothetical protein [Erythrobacter sp. WG]|jgi:hypothetical protein|uniref:hypothetical protein n=1 Tax=Erythrobacter sp. WG TaxID=2985510 RepID=UPI00227055F8|nr:hypothetical protein [Erythrobacter sp. WG]MCX9147459.1 hypothetical protein [Erythrobacter sp. WG]
MNTYHVMGASIGLALAAVGATAAGAQRYDDHEYGNDHNSLTLVCWGEGRRPSTNVAGGYAWDSNRHKFVPHTYLNNTTQEFDSEVQVELHDDWGRIHLTGKLVPAIHSGGNNGWWELENVHVGPDTITARYRLNGLNKPRIEIDRRSGRIKIMGATTFRGECEQGNWGERGNRF